ncbi:bifunctional hydroxymethylpyrimidine kinase/phosphomethylpyrimidine kinase [Alloacidobacterium sp.]|uniref:bifunctional hydroxymethylpyrimidine kinase/phosphomethylpyrimidine kinase n=1 Tax=Alloacidobacterium sp. TaxID=2951999 RepID=UPI002D488119|nr:bifunctional hydroxymethylpyrimidine kinase/phosphomethylpyrimidine kinase [Alloacidobacterium sp.]HYK37375.1 bifunctional hydroxymethylpyrimidine kinase/phosphomethylpyrimidine kinase [Alloacidobacterium sp.]
MRADAKFSARPIALTIAGFDPSCGAGITADLKVFAAHNIYGIACITALTVQSSMGVKRVEPVAPQTVRETLDDLLEDVLPNGVKVGMLATADAVSKTAQFLAKSGIGRQRIVLDPVIRSSSGRELLSPEGVAALRSELLPLVGWVTPNIEELAVLAGSPASVREDVPDAAARLQFLTSEGGNRDLHIVATGGHLDSVDDFLLTPNGKGQWVKGERVETQSTHGTGCAFSSALLCQLIAGRSPEKAAMEAKAYVSAALKAAYPVGRGTGSMHHLFRLT